MMDYQKTRPGFFGLGSSDKPVETAGFSSQGAGDIEAVINNDPFNIEIKLNSKAQLGSGKFLSLLMPLHMLVKDWRKKLNQMTLLSS